MKRLLIAILATSLITGFATANEGKEGDWKQRHHEQMEQALSQIPQDKATLVRNWMQQMKQERKAAHQQLKELHKQVKTIASAETFDKGAFLAKMTQIRQIKSQRAEKYALTAADLGEKLTAQERNTLLKAFKGHDGHGHHNEKQEDQHHSN
ncbi:hypothetical protein TAO_1601 [Candidatus Nitrosoglobus terrae]|uniref:Signaling pathway modulator ZraP n=1 Tax=Candidatus Nitrosoglobus terrae TaxID=1630141 RepID=A0A1Q2SPC5_9GAMM|nr:periplasmic heavy metal sensor [Candidatus Nitrosoglobus terrae]BAW80971.1 hypothetical protein TAO_1601 [Candidatus Nitrosoglobus terrae]